MDKPSWRITMSGKLREWYRQLAAIFCFRILKPFCIDQSIGQYVSLSAVGFHKAFENNPQIVFQGCRRGLGFYSHRISRCCSVIVHYLAADLWKDPRMTRWWRRIGIAEPLIDSLYLLAPPSTCGYNDYKEYSIAPNTQKPQGRIVVYTVLTGN